MLVQLNMSRFTKNFVREQPPSIMLSSQVIWSLERILALASVLCSNLLARRHRLETAEHTWHDEPECFLGNKDRIIFEAACVASECFRTCVRCRSTLFSSNNGGARHSRCQGHETLHKRLQALYFQEISNDESCQSKRTLAKSAVCGIDFLLLCLGCLSLNYSWLL